MKISLLGVNINAQTKIQILGQIANLLNNNRPIFITTPYSEMIVRSQKDKEFRDILNSADFALPDGIGILWAARYSLLATHYSLLNVWYLIVSLASIIFYPKYVHSPIPERISGSDFIWDLARLAADRGYSIFLLGGFDDTPALAAQKLKSKFPNLKIAGISAELSFPRRRESSSRIENNSGSPRPESGMTQKIINQINSSSADFLFVALGPVVQEKWIYENLPNLRCRLAIGLGGTFDYLTGKRLPAPQIWANLGLEWLWRLLTQPWRLLRISRGVLGLIWYAFKGKMGN